MGAHYKRNQWLKRHNRASEGGPKAGQEQLNCVGGLDTRNVLEELIRKYRRSGRPLSVNFRKLLPSLKSADRYTHLIHPYPAKLLGHIPSLFLGNDLLSKPGDRVLDPFCGSGTVLLEAQIARRQAYGVDANPLARLIARVKTTPLRTTTLRNAVPRI